MNRKISGLRDRELTMSLTLKGEDGQLYSKEVYINHPKPFDLQIQFDIHKYRGADLNETIDDMVSGSMGDFLYDLVQDLIDTADRPNKEEREQTIDF